MKLSVEGGAHTAVAADGYKQIRLVDAAQQFEATMLQELLKPMLHNENSWGGEEKSNDPASDTISSFGTEAVAKAISKGGGFGIAKEIVSKMSLEYPRMTKRKTFQY